MANNVTLLPVAMGNYPADISVYAPSKLRPPETITEAEFLERFADHAKNGVVSVDGGEPKCITMYGHGLNCWYIVV